jgi:hypothetical protein
VAPRAREQRVVCRVVCHGDACVPNTLLDRTGRWIGHVDLGTLGVGDRWADLAIATLSTEWNYGPGWAGGCIVAPGRVGVVKNCVRKYMSCVFTLLITGEREQAGITRTRPQAQVQYQPEPPRCVGELTNPTTVAYNFQALRPFGNVHLTGAPRSGVNKDLDTRPPLRAHRARA